MRKVLYISGTRADFGLMQSTLDQINADPDLSLGVLATGMHLSPDHGETWREVEASGLRLVAKVPADLTPPTGATMAVAIGQMIAAFVPIFVQEAPDVVLLLGDRGEMLAGAIAALHLNIPVAHIHGGERSGTVDEPVRHAISKLSHLHFAATAASRTRLIGLGEQPDHVFVTGAPGLDGLTDQTLIPRDRLISDAGLDPAHPTALVLFHPVLQEATGAADQMRALLTALERTGWQSIALMPNADAGSQGIRDVLEREAPALMQKRVHLPRPEFICHMAVLDAMVGNSSAGIIEAASFGTPVINIGSRQTLRERNANVRDIPPEARAIEAALLAAQAGGRFAPDNLYGDGQAGQRITQHLKTVPLGPGLMSKVLAY